MMKFISNNAYNKDEKRKLSDLFKKSDKNIHSNNLMPYNDVNSLLVQYYGFNESKFIIVMLYYNTRTISFLNSKLIKRKSLTMKISQARYSLKENQTRMII